MRVVVQRRWEEREEEQELAEGWPDSCRGFYYAVARRLLEAIGFSSCY